MIKDCDAFQTLTLSLISEKIPEWSKRSEEFIFKYYLKIGFRFYTGQRDDIRSILLSY